MFVYSEDGEFQYSFGSRGSDLGEVECQTCICIGHDGLVYVVGYKNDSVLVFQQDGQFIQQFGGDVLGGVATTEDGHIVITSFDTDKVSIFTPGGECVHKVKDVGLRFPCGVVVDKNVLFL